MKMELYNIAKPTGYIAKAVSILQRMISNLEKLEKRVN
jgi:hypothetical protein